MASRRVKVAGMALGLLAGLAGGLFGYRAHALRKQAAAAAHAPAAHADPHGAPPAPRGEGPPPAPGSTPQAAAGHEPAPPAAAESLTPAEREARLLARLDAPADHAPEHGAAPPASPGHGGPPAPVHPASPGLFAHGLAAPPPGSPAAREAELLRRAAEGQLPAATQPLFRIGSIAGISAEGRAQADQLTHGLAREEERQAILSVWPPIADAEPPPGPHLPVAKPPPPKPRPPRLELPSRLDQWGE